MTTQTYNGVTIYQVGYGWVANLGELRLQADSLYEMKLKLDSYL